MSDLKNSSNHSFALIVARITFVLYLIFILWEGGPPFGDSIKDVGDVTTSSMVAQIVIGILFIAACISLYPILNQFTVLLKKEKFLLLFLLWCLFSILWSDFKFVSFKRYFQVLAGMTICCAFLLHTNSFTHILKYLKIPFIFYIPLTILAIIFVPAAMDDDLISWRGLASQKNQLGQISLVSLLIWSYSFRHDIGVKKIVAIVMSISSLILLVGSKSITSILTIVLLSLLMIIISINNRFNKIGVGRFFSILSILSLLGLIILTIKYDSSIITTTLPALFGKNSSFSGRDVIWSYVYNNIKTHLFFGCGYGGFWVVNNSEVLSLYEDLNIIIFQGHMGYIDLLNEEGICGILLFFMMVVNYFASLLENKGNSLILYFLIGSLIINLQETILFRPNTLIGVIFILFYLSLHIEKNHKSQHVPIYQIQR